MSFHRPQLVCTLGQGVTGGRHLKQPKNHSPCFVQTRCCRNGARSQSTIRTFRLDLTAKARVKLIRFNQLLTFQKLIWASLNLSPFSKIFVLEFSQAMLQQRGSWLIHEIGPICQAGVFLGKNFVFRLSGWKTKPQHSTAHLRVSRCLIHLSATWSQNQQSHHYCKLRVQRVYQRA